VQLPPGTIQAAGNLDSVAAAAAKTSRSHAMSLVRAIPNVARRRQGSSCSGASVANRYNGWADSP